MASMAAARTSGSGSSRKKTGPAEQTGGPRAKYLDKILRTALEGSLQITRHQIAKDFLESISTKQDKTTCLERLTSSKNGLTALHKALAVTDTAEFMNTAVSDLFAFLADPELKRLCDGELLNQVLWAIADPPSFWNNLLRNVRNRSLNSQAMEGFTWLLLHLIMLPSTQSKDFRETAISLLAQEDTPLAPVPASPKVEQLVQKIRALVSPPSASVLSSVPANVAGPGGRHDNDFVNYRDIVILPTRAELLSTERSYYLSAASVAAAEEAIRASTHIDNQFRLLRQDMVGAMQEEFQNVAKPKGRRRRNVFIRKLKPLGFDELSGRPKPSTFVFECSYDFLSQYLKIPGANKPQDRKKALTGPRAGFFLRHLSLGCLLQNNNVLGFASVDRNEDKLALDPPQLCLRITSLDSVEQVFNALQTDTIDYLELSVPLFAYEPILERLKSKVEAELSNDILGISEPSLSPLCPQGIVDSLEQVMSATATSDLQPVLGLSKSAHLDPSQIRALIHGLTYQVSLIQGPPGTGKSLVGAILAKILLSNTNETMLVLSYTNHALDQFIEDLMDIGVDHDMIVRLGSKSTDRTKPLLLGNQQESGVNRSRTRWELIDAQRNRMNDLHETLKDELVDFNDAIPAEQILENFLFSPTDAHFHDALTLPETPEGETVVGQKGRKMRKDYLFRRWQEGRNAGAFMRRMRDPEFNSVWSLSREDRQAKIQGWREQIRQEKLKDMITYIEQFNKSYKTLQGLQKEKTENILRTKRVIACTTTAASMFASEIQAAGPGIVLVEEAGEILESHILAAMGPSTKQLIQIGDHKQLRPKVANYKLSVECGSGYDLNRSQFERLVRLGRPSCTLLNQHRMRPEISELIRHNYPDLLDASGTENRPHLLGFQHDVVFINHSHAETNNSTLVDGPDATMKSSKQNGYEADMVLKCVRYLGQQNYKTDNIVILTPYLGQLHLLKEKLSNDLDPVLSDFDSHELVQAGALPAASAAINKKPIRLSTIDNYQGEESDIVIASLTRSNEEGEIGFMAAPERLNVLVSRARNALLMIGNAETFMRARKGGEEWQRLLERLKSRGQVYDGFPVRCEKHPDRIMTLRSPDEFDLHCPDGGCTEPCTELLSCGKHKCPKRCHIRVDHSQIPCDQVMVDRCSNGHKVTWQCAAKRPPPCQTCRMEKEEKERKAKRDKELEAERQAREWAYRKKLAALQAQIEQRRQEKKDRQEEKERNQTLQQHLTELARITNEAATPLVGSTVDNPSSSNTVAATNRQPDIKAGPNTGIAANTNTGDQQPVVKPEPRLQSDRHAPDETDNAGAANRHDTSANEDPTESTVEEKLSPAESDWKRQKELELASNEALDSLMEMIGLETVKAEFLNIKARVDTAIRQEVDLKGDRFGAALLGNPGTGKTTVARLYGKFLSSVGVIPGNHFEETTGSRLAHDGVQGAQALLDNLLQNGGGVFFLDEAYQIVSGSSVGGSQVLDFLLAEIENQTGKIVFVFAGYRKQMETFFAHNPGIPSRIPILLDFQDYNDQELLRIMQHSIDKKYSGRMAIDGGPGGLYMRIAARRIARGRGREGFGNAREVQNVLSSLWKRQAERIQKSRRNGENPDDLLLTKIDLIGPEPSLAIASNEDWQRLQKMIGLKSVKQSIQVLVDRLQTNYERELNEQPLVECSLNKVFVGNPGTGKTTVAKLYGKILAALGLLSNGEVIIKNPADFVGSVLGQSEKNTKAILEATKGKVLIIDEAYMLGSGLSDTGGTSDPYKTAVIDTIVAEVQSTSLEDRCVLLLGYQSMMEDMFQKVNPGLARRFPMSSAFVFEDYDDSELRSILDLKLNQQGFRAGEAAKKAVISVLARARNRPNFGNAGEVDILLDQAKERQQKRLSETVGPKKKPDLLVPQDIDPDFDRLEQAGTNIKMLFKDVVGCEEVIQQLEEYQQLVQNMKADGFSDSDVRAQVPFGLLFRGPPGTGKTSTARKMGKVYYDLGLLTEAKVVDCSATDLIGQYVGHTGPKVQKKFDEALGRVLFVDEAYRLAEGHFAKEAMDEIVDCLTKERYQNKILVILAGYDDDINRLMNQNPGLTSRFSETISFHHMPPRHCRKLLFQCLSGRKLDTAQLESSPTLDSTLLDLFGRLSQTPSWGNARDVQTLAKAIFSRTMRSKTQGASPARMVTEEVVLDALNTMLSERSNRAAPSKATLSDVLNIEAPKAQPQVAFNEPPPEYKTSIDTISDIAQTTVVTATEVSEKDGDDDAGSKSRGAPRRDAGVSDAVWEQLQRDSEAAQRRKQELETSRREAARLEREMREKEEALRRERDDAAHREFLRLLELARIEWEQAEKERKEKEERMRKETEMKKKLQRMGRCPVGFEWIPQADGYRCAGGSHFMCNAELGL